MPSPWGGQCNSRRLTHCGLGTKLHRSGTLTLRHQPASASSTCLLTVAYAGDPSGGSVIGFGDCRTRASAILASSLASRGADCPSRCSYAPGCPKGTLGIRGMYQQTRRASISRLACSSTFRVPSFPRNSSLLRVLSITDNSVKRRWTPLKKLCVG